MTTPIPRAAPRVAEVRTSAMLAAPLVVGHLSTGLIGFVDSVIAGHHGTAHAGVGRRRHRAVLAADDGADGHADGACRRRCRNSTAPGAAHEIGALFRQALWLAAMLGVVLFAFLSVVGYRAGADGHRAGHPPGHARLPARHPLGRAGADAVPGMRYLSDGLHWTLPTMLLGFGGLLVLVPLGYALTFGVGGVAANWAPADSASRRR